MSTWCCDISSLPYNVHIRTDSGKAITAARRHTNVGAIACASALGSAARVVKIYDMGPGHNTGHELKNLLTTLQQAQSGDLIITDIAKGRNTFENNFDVGTPCGRLALEILAMAAARGVAFTRAQTLAERQLMAYTHTVAISEGRLQRARAIQAENQPLLGESLELDKLPLAIRIWILNLDAGNALYDYAAGLNKYKRITHTHSDDLIRNTYQKLIDAIEGYALDKPDATRFRNALVSVLKSLPPDPYHDRFAKDPVLLEIDLDAPPAIAEGRSRFQRQLASRRAGRPPDPTRLITR